MSEKLTTYDPTEDITSNAAIAAFMAEALSTGDTRYIAHALGVVMKALGIKLAANVCA